MNHSPRQGVVAVICQSSRLLTIERSATVRAPGMICFPGGGIEDNESPVEALRRELVEELNLDVFPQRCLWTSQTESGVDLQWWLATITNDAIPRANPAEVADIFWMTAQSLADHPRLLPSNREFLRAIAQRKIDLDLEP